MTVRDIYPLHNVLLSSRYNLAAFSCLQWDAHGFVVWHLMTPLTYMLLWRVVSRAFDMSTVVSQAGWSAGPPGFAHSVVENIFQLTLADWQSTAYTAVCEIISCTCPNELMCLRWNFKKKKGFLLLCELYVNTFPPLTPLFPSCGFVVRVQI